MSKSVKHKIYFSVCGEGYGHSSRDMAIAKVLLGSGAEVLMGSYGYVLERLKKSFNSVEVEKEFEMAGNNGTFDLKATLSKSKSSIIKLPKMVSYEKEIMKRFGATCLVSDGRWAPVIAAYRLEIPCVIVANQTCLEPFFKDRSLFFRLLGKNIDFTIETGTALAESVIVPDFPPPDTVCRNTLSRSESIVEKQIFVGPVVSSDILQKEKARRLDVKRPFILTLLGGHAFRLPIFEGILEVAGEFPKTTFLIFTKFRSNNIPPNVIVREFAEDISQYMKAAELIITQAGHSTAMEILTLGKPALIIPDKGQVEQECNAKRMSELGVAEVLDYGNLKPENISEKINLFLCDKKYLENAKKYSKMAKKMNGAKKAAEIILKMSGKFQDRKR